jgi:Caudovirus prohead serine protease
VSGLVLDGRVVIYGQPHWFRGQQDIFEAGCFAGSLDMVWMGIDHKFFEPPLGREEDGSLELFDDDVALHFRLKLGPGALERLDGRSEASAAYVVHSSEMRNGIRHIKRATLLEISACHVATIRQTHCYVRDADKVGTLAEDARTRFAGDGAFTKMMAALRKLDNG